MPSQKQSKTATLLSDFSFSKSFLYVARAKKREREAEALIYSNDKKKDETMKCFDWENKSVCLVICSNDWFRRSLDPLRPRGRGPFWKFIPSLTLQHFILFILEYVSDTCSYVVSSQDETETICIFKYFCLSDLRRLFMLRLTQSFYTDLSS